MSNLSDFTSSGASVPSAGVSFDGMPLIGDTSGGRTSASLYSTTLYVKTGVTTIYTRNSTALFTAIFPSSMNNGVYISTANTANTWYTIINTSGTKGKLFNVIPSMSTAGGAVIDIEVTIDGVVRTYTFTEGGFNTTGTLGAIQQRGHSPHTTTTMDYNETSSLLGAYGDQGFSASSVNILVSPWQALKEGFPYLQWTTDMQVRVRSSLVTAGGYLQQAAASFMYDS